MTIFCFSIALAATFLGSLTGLGGGVIIKPALDLFLGNQLILSQISILSASTVFAMALYSTAKGLRNGVELPITKMITLGISAGVGGYIGEYCFRVVIQIFGETICGRVQTISLIVLITAVLILYCVKDRISTLAIQNLFVIAAIGFSLGTASSFLGIGGGPINVIMLSLLLSFDDKQCVFGSLFIIIFAQLIKLTTVVAGGKFDIPSSFLLLSMIVGGILGGMIGSRLVLKIDNKVVRYSFKASMVCIIAINAVVLAKSFG